MQECPNAERKMEGNSEQRFTLMSLMQYDGIKFQHHFVDGYPENLGNRKEVAFFYCTFTSFLPNIKKIARKVLSDWRGFKEKRATKGC